MNNIEYNIEEYDAHNADDNAIENEIMSIVDDYYIGTKNTNDSEFDKILSLQMYYQDNYTKNELLHIAHYYNISTRKKKKVDIVQDIVLFENDPTNDEIVSKRKLMWYYASELKNDRFFKKFIIFQ